MSTVKTVYFFVKKHLGCTDGQTEGIREETWNQIQSSF